MDKPRILVVDDEESIQYVLQNFLEIKNCEVQTAASAEEAIELLSDHPPAVALLDIVLPGKNGIELLAEVKQRVEDCQVIMITSHGSVESAVGAIRLGAYDYLTKPFENLEQVWIAVERALEKRALLLDRDHQHSEISGTIDRLSSLLDRRAATGDPALVPGFVPGQPITNGEEPTSSETPEEEKAEPCLDGKRES